PLRRGLEVLPHTEKHGLLVEGLLQERIDPGAFIERQLGQRQSQAICDGALGIEGACERQLLEGVGIDEALRCWTLWNARGRDGELWVPLDRGAWQAQALGQFGDAIGAL